jgi:Glycosyl transferase family 2
VSETNRAATAAGRTVDRPHVSVILPTYQRRELVQRAVASVLAQSYRDFELIVVDDGSTDGTGEALAALGDAIRYTWQPNRGPAAARNAGLRLARGSIVAFLDSDDRWLPDHLAVMTETLARNPAAVLVSTCPRFRIGGRELPRNACLVDHRDSLIGAESAGWPSCTAARTEDVRAVGGFNEALRAAEDSDLFVRLARRGPFVTLQRRTLLRQRTVGSVSDRARRAGHYLEAAAISSKALVAELERGGDSDSETLLEQAKGAAQLAAALRALSEADEATARSALAEACRLLPRLSGRAGLIASRLEKQMPLWHEPEMRLRILLTALKAWPDRRSDVGRYLRAWAVLTALRLGRLQEAAVLARRWPVAGTIGFCWRVAPLLRARFRRRALERLHRGREDARIEEARP